MPMNRKAEPSLVPLATRLRRDGVPVWLDEWELQPGEEWQSKVKAALEESQNRFGHCFQIVA